MKPSDELTQVICAAIDAYRITQRPNLTALQILTSLERVRYGITEALLKHQKIKS